MTLTRRGLMTGTIGALATLGLTGLVPLPALAQSADAAKAHVQTTIDQVLGLVQDGGSSNAKAPQLRGIMESTSAMPQIARFSAGRAWNDMTPDQQGRYVDAFANYIARIYARRFDEYKGQDIVIGRVIDAGKKGMLVQSTVSGSGQEPVLVEWLVSDRGGKVQITDIVIEGVSLALTQREEIGSMLNQRGNDVERLIQDLGSA